MSRFNAYLFDYVLPNHVLHNQLNMRQIDSFFAVVLRRVAVLLPTIYTGFTIFTKGLLYLLNRVSSN